MGSLCVYEKRFAESGFRVFERALHESRRRNQNYVSLGHLLVALAAEDGGSFKFHFAKLRAAHGLRADVVPSDQAVEQILKLSPKYDGKGVHVGAETIQFLRRAMTIAGSNGREKIEAADLLSAFLEVAPISYVRPNQGERL